MSAPKLFRTPYTFDTPDGAIDFFEANRAEGVESLPESVRLFLHDVAAYDSEAVYNVQPGLKTHYITAARPDDRFAWFYAKPGGVTFCVGHSRNVDAVLDYWGEAKEPAKENILLTDVLFQLDEMDSPGVEFCLRLSAAWGAR